LTRQSVIGRDLLILFFSNLGYSLGMMIVNPLFPLYLKDLGANATEISLVITSSGIISTLFMAASTLFAQRFGEKPVMIVSAAASLIPQLVFAMIGQWKDTVIWSMIFNASWATRMPTQILYITKQSQSRAIGRVFGFMNLVWPLSNIAGPLIGGYLADEWGWRYAFFTSALMFLLCIIPLLLLKNGPSASSSSSTNNTYRQLFQKQRHRRTILSFSLSQFLIAASIGWINLIIPLYLTDVFGLTKTMVGLYFSIGGGVSMLLVQIPSGRLTDKYGGKKVMLPFLLGIPIAIATYPFMSNYFVLLVLFMAISGFHSATWPASMSYLMKLVPASLRGVAIGFRQTMIRLGFTIGPFLGGMLWEYGDSVVSFVAASSVAILSVVFVFIISDD
jgi:MFS family permease